VWDKVNKDQLVDEYSERLAVDPNVIVADENVLMIRQSRVQQEQMARMASMAPAMKDGAQAIKTLSETDTANPAMSAGAQVMRNYTGL